MPASASPSRSGRPCAPAPDHTARRSRLAAVGLVLVLLAISAFAVWSSEATARSAHTATTASRLSDDYETATQAIAAEESLERKYRLEPGPDVRVRYDQAATSLVASLARVGEDGGAADRARARSVLTEHAVYLRGIARLFGATDRGDTELALTVDRDEVDPAFGRIEQVVDAAARAQHLESTAALMRLERLERLTSRLTPLVFLIGLLLAAVLTSITRGHQRLLTAERAQAVHDALHDALTGLPNRTLLADRFTQALQAGRRDGTCTGLLLIDLDRFKEINDTFGHHYGDLLLTQVGPRLTGALREVDTVARLGGDEFAVLLPGVADVAGATAVAAKLRAALETPFRVEGVDLDVEASVGVVLSGRHGHEPAVLLQRADIAMYVAKSQGLGVVAYDPAVDGHSPAKLALLGDLRRALERCELVLHYQPKVSLSTGEVVGVEALVRWEHPERGLIPPDDFIPLAEHTGLIGPLTRYVLDRALGQARVWAAAGHPLQVAVNLSARNLLDERLPAIVAELLAVHGVPARLLKLEVTESALMTEPGRARRLLEQLVAVGICISVDDFGAGYTSLSQLKDLPVGELKIDRSFVLTMTSDRSNALIVQSVVDLGHNLGLTTVAEGVETPEALAALAVFGCDVAQGYHLSRPMPPAAFQEWYATRARPPQVPVAQAVPAQMAAPTPGRASRPDRYVRGT